MGQDIGFRISRTGKNALTSTDLRDFVVNSKYQSLKILKYGNSQITVANNASATVDIVHGLGYPPLYLAYYDIDNNGRFWLDATSQGSLSVLSSGNAGGDPTLSLVDRYKIRFSANNTPQGNGVGFTAPFRYVIFDQPAFDPASGNDKPVGYSSSNIGMIVTPTGKDATKSKVYDQVVNSNCDYLKSHSTQVLNTSFSNAANGQKSIDFIHGLGYVPLFLAYGYFDSSVQEGALPRGRAPAAFISSAFADTNKITVELCWAGSPSPATFNFYARIVVFENNMLS